MAVVLSGLQLIWTEIILVILYRTHVERFFDFAKSRL